MLGTHWELDGNKKNPTLPPSPKRKKKTPPPPPPPPLGACCLISLAARVVFGLLGFFPIFGLG